MQQVPQVPRVPQVQERGAMQQVQKGQLKVGEKQVHFVQIQALLILSSCKKKTDNLNLGFMMNLDGLMTSKIS